jgi:hypothetical protein
MTTPTKIIMDLQRLNETNAEGCLACGNKFSLGDSAVMACGAWEGGPKLIHANEAVFDKKSGTYMDRRCFLAQQP